MLPERIGKILIVLVTVMAFCLGGSTQIWAKGIIFLAMGITVALAPPRRLPRWGISLAVLLLMLWGLTAFLPSGLGGSPDWRRALTEDFGIPLGGMISAQPWVSLQAFANLLAGGFWLLFVIAHRWEDDERRTAIRVLCWSITAVAAIALICHFTGNYMKYWGSFKNFGPFPNRNHFATLLSIGAVLSATCAYDINRRRGRSWPLYLIPLAVLFAAIVINNSRAGIYLSFGGLLVWLVLVSVASKSTARIAIAGSILIIAVAGFFAFGGGLLKRVALNEEWVSTLASDGRIPIYLDCLRLLGKGPVFGTGLGNFEGVFSMNQAHYWNNDNRPIHPESDWMWLLVEMGIPALLLAGLALGLIIRSFGGIRPRKDSLRHQHRLRVGALIAGLLIPLHGTFDIPGHVLGTALPAILLLALSASRRLYVPSKWAPHVIRLGALPIFAAAALAGALHLTSLPIPSKTGALKSYGLSVAASERDSGASHAYADRAVTWAPLQWDYYYMRALQSIPAGRNYREAQADFRRARYLEQQARSLPEAEAQFWLENRPELALPAWRELLERDPTRQHEHYGNMLRATKEHPDLALPVRALARFSPRLRLLLLAQLQKEEFTPELEQLLREDPDLEKLNQIEKERLFTLWATRGDRASLLEALDANRPWMDSGWMHAATARADAGDYQNAADLARRYIPEPAVPSPPPGQSLKKLEQDFYLNPTDVIRGLAVWSTQILVDPQAALTTIEQIAELPQAPTYSGYLRAKTLLELGEHRKAWEAYRAYFKTLRQTLKLSETARV